MAKHVYVLGIAAALAATAAAAQQPQYSSKDIIDTFAKKPAQATDACTAKGMVADEDGVCEPVKNARGFSLPTRANLHAAPAAASMPAPVARAPAAHGRTVASVSRHLPAAAAAPTPQAKRNLLITFKTGSSELTDQAKANAKVFAQALQSSALADSRFSIDGYTDATGDKAKNQTLSDERAASVKSFLVSQGVSDSRLETHGHGASDFALPKAPTSPANRRVEARRLD